METTIDKFGRVVIPKRLREDLDLHPGIVLRIKQDERKISIEPVQDEPTFVVKKGVLVYQGAATGNIERAIHNHRHERINKIVSDLNK